MPASATVSVVIPAYNEIGTFEQLLEQVLNVDIAPFQKEIIVIESNSTDGTRDMVKKYETRGRIKAIYEERPQGKGHAVKQGLKMASGEIVLIQDADFEYRPSEYPDLLAPFNDSNVQFVLGSRHMGRGTWRYRKFLKDKMTAHVFNFGNHLCNFLFNTIYGVRLTDPTTMFKVFRKSAVAAMRFKSNYFELDWEIVAKLIRAGHVPIEVPITYVSRSFEEGKKIKFWRDGLLSLYAIFRFRWWD